MIDHEVLDTGLGDEDDDDFDSAAAADDLLPIDRFLDRELSWLAFNQRVLELAEDGFKAHGLLVEPRVRFVDGVLLAVRLGLDLAI